VGRGRLFDAVARLLEYCAAVRPLLAGLERSPRVTRVNVGPLGASGVESLLTYLRSEPPTPALLADVVERTGGVPFFVEELASRQPGQPLPDTLRDLLLLRVQALSDPAQRVLAAASVGVARVAHVDLAAAVDLDRGGLDAALREAAEAQLLRVDRDLPGYAIRHALLREAVLEDLLPGELTALHEKWAQALQERLDGAPTDAGLAVQVSHHWFAALDLPHAFDAALAAAEAARAAYAPWEESQMLDRALQLWPRIPDPQTAAAGDRAVLLERAGTAAHDAGDDDRSADFYDSALAEVDPAVNPDRHAHLLIKRSDMDDPESLPRLTEALGLLPADPSADRALALGTLAGWHAVRNRWDEAAELAEEARQVARRVPDAEAESWASLLLRGPSREPASLTSPWACSRRGGNSRWKPDPSGPWASSGSVSVISC